MNELQKECDELAIAVRGYEEECKALKAHVERLREALIEVSGINFTEPTKRLEDRQSWKRAKKIFDSVPPQSLTHIKAQVEEETIEDYNEYLQSNGVSLSFYYGRRYTRKYAKDGE